MCAECVIISDGEDEGDLKAIYIYIVNVSAAAFASISLVYGFGFVSFRMAVINGFIRI